MLIRTLVSRLAVGAALALAVAPLGGQASQLGQWSAVFSMPLVAVHAALLRTGDLLFFDAWEIPGTPSARLWNPDTNGYTPVPNGFAELFCAGHILTADGRLLTTGGHNGAGVGTTDATFFDLASMPNPWTPLPDMNYARWYPSLIQLADGRALTLGGAISRPNNAEVPELLSIGGSWQAMGGAQKDVGEYPQTFQAPDGRVFVNGSDASLQSWLFNVNTSTWSPLGRGPAAAGTGVMYRPGKIMMTGGGTLGVDPVTGSTGVIDLNVGSPSWRQVGSMAHGRSQHNLVILPDGKVLVIGGAGEVSLIATNGVKPAEIWDPDTETWTQVASMARSRMYHSIAILLPDGRVLAAGGGRINVAVTDETNGEFYSPPYLFRGDRPEVTSAPASVAYGAAFAVESPDADDVARVTLVRASSVTHGINLDQRFFELSFTRSGDTLTAWAPSDPNIALAGDYLLFALNGDDVPSMGRVVRLGGTAGPVSLSIGDVSVNEGTVAPNSLVFTVSLTSAASQTVTVNYATAGGSAQADVDYGSRSGGLSFPAGTVVRTITVPTIPDDLVEPNETFTVQLSGASNATLGDATGLGTIVNDDVPAVPSVSINSVNVVEESGSGTPVAAFTVSLSNAAAANVLVNYHTLPGSATAPADYTSTSGTLTFAGGTTVQTIQVPIVPDLAPEADETFTVELYAPVNATLGTAQGTATIVDDDTPGSLTTKTFVVASAADDVNEDGATFSAGGNAWLGQGGQTGASYLGLRFTGVSIPAGATVTAARLELTAATTQWLGINVEMAAEATSNSVPFASAARPSVRPLTAARVPHVSDVQWLAGTRYALDDIAMVVHEVVNRPGWAAGNALSVIVHGTGPTAWARKHVSSADGGAGAAPRLVVTYSAPAPPPNLPPVITGATATPPAGPAPLAVGFSASATDPENAQLTYSWAYGDGATGSGPAAAHVYTTPGVYTVTLTVSDGSLVATAGPIGVTVVTPGIPGLSIGDATVTEGQAGSTPALFTVSLSAPSAAPVTVNYGTVDATAVAPVDYVAAGGTLTFPPGSTSQTVTVAVSGDVEVEASETFAVVLSSAAGASIVDGSATGTIVNDDVPVVQAPRDLVATVARNTVQFTWQPPASAGPVAGYLLDAGLQPGATLLTVPLGADPVFVTAAPDGIYFVRVRALLASGPGPASNEVRVTLGTAAAPLPPLALLATVQGRSVALQWTENPMGSAPSGYQLHVGTASGLADLGVVPFAASSRGLAVAVAPGTYFVRVLAASAAGASAPSNEAVVTTGVGMCTIPTAPIGLAAHGAGGMASVGWSAAVAGAIPTSYELRVGRVSGVSDLGVLVLPAAMTALSGPVPSGTYYLQVAAVNACGTSASSAEIAVTVP